MKLILSRLYSNYSNILHQKLENHLWNHHDDWYLTSHAWYIYRISRAALITAVSVYHDLHLSSCRGTAAGQHSAASRTSSSAAGASRSRTPPSPLPGCTWSRVTRHVSRVCGPAVRSRLSCCSPASAAMMTPTHHPLRRGQGHSPLGVDIMWISWISRRYFLDTF